MDRTTDGTSPEAVREEDYMLDRRRVAAILFAADRDDRDAVMSLLEPLHPADVADLLEQINAFDRARLIRLMGEDFDGEILSELDEGLRDSIIPILPRHILAEAVRELDSDDVVDLVEDLGTAEAEAILGALDRTGRAAVEGSLSWPENSAGRMMQREVVAAPEHWTVGEVIDFMRAADHMPEQFYHVILVDPRMRPVATVALGRIMGASRETDLAGIAEDVFEIIPATRDEGDVAYAFNQYHLISAPVVDESGRLVGMITIDDAMAVLDAEHEEDMLLMAGVTESSVSDTVSETSRARVPWLFLALASGFLSSLVVAQFEAVIAAYVALAILMPVVAGMGGNAATQTLTVTVRALATKDLTASNIWRVLKREILVGLLNGAVFAVAVGIAGTIWFGLPQLGMVVAVAMVINLLIAGLAGTLVPVLLDRLDIDPALASGTFVSTTTDLLGFLVFLGLASLVLM